MAPKPLNPSTFADSQLTLLATEQAAETSSTATLLSSTSPTTLARAGLAITNLVISSQRTGLGGKTVLELEQDHAIGNDGVVGEHGVRVGDIVRVGEQPKGGERKKEKATMENRGCEGVVVRVNNKGLQVALGEGKGEEDGLGGRLWVVKLANDVTYKRMNQTMERLKKMEEKEYTTLARILFGLDTPTPVQQASEDDVKFFDETLDNSQRDAVKFALASRETGKTYTLIELILQLLHRKMRILVCGPSNISVDNIVERLAPHKIPILRLGHPARLLPSVLNHSLEVLTQTSEAASIVKDVRKEMDAKQASIKKTRNGRERRAIYTDMKDLRKEYREREKQCVSTLVGGSKVVLATLHGAGGYQLRNEEFDVVIIDEASQALEAQCWIPLLVAKKLVLAGDHLQLPPTVKSTPSKAKPEKDKSKSESKDTLTLETTLFSRLLTLHGPSIKHMLTTQYRMHEKIMRFPSDAMYDSALIAAPSVAGRLLTTLLYPVEDTDDTREPLIFCDTQGGDFPESAASDEASGGDGKTPTKGSLLNDSKSNPSEALLVKAHVSALIAAGVHAEDIAVITPYNAQLSYLSHDLGLKEQFPGIELGSVDGFQGREKEAVVVSLVRSNEAKEVGFLAEERRLNVAMTRPKRQLCAIGDSETVGKGSEFLKKWMEHLEGEADLRYPNVADLQES
ncbi:hypothetical protein OEA41_000690 [Lepraria neglecta]|uniref:DNA helicase n=1 Tax=Lepraria neglecta TaxID=209136 RepID=A0AAD9ZIN1_9LECA|nr:hypothetical protein OEA41_000690 [Lepraria neglecta]